MSYLSIHGHLRSILGAKTFRIHGFKVIPASNVPSKKEGLNPEDIKGPFTHVHSLEGEKSDKFFLTTTLIGAKLYAYKAFAPHRSRREQNKNYKDYLDSLPAGEKPMSFEDFAELKTKSKGFKRLALIEVSFDSTKPRMSKSLDEAFFMDVGDEFWVEHKDIIPDSIKIENVYYVTEDDIKDIEEFSETQYSRRPQRFKNPDIYVHSKSKMEEVQKTLELKPYMMSDTIPEGTIVGLVWPVGRSESYMTKMPKQKVINKLKEMGFVSSKELDDKAFYRYYGYQDYYELRTAGTFKERFIMLHTLASAVNKIAGEMNPIKPPKKSTNPHFKVLNVPDMPTDFKWVLITNEKGDPIDRCQGESDAMDMAAWITGAELLSLRDSQGNSHATIGRWPDKKLTALGFQRNKEFIYNYHKRYIPAIEALLLSNEISEIPSAIGQPLSVLDMKDPAFLKKVIKQKPALLTKKDMEEIQKDESLKS